MALAFLLFSALGCLVLLLLYVTLFDIHGIPLYSILDENSKGRPVLWSDEFEAEGYPSEINWIPEVGGAGWGNNELQYYTRNSNAYVSDGNLVISTKKERFRGKCWRLVFGKVLSGLSFPRIRISSVKM